MNYIKSIALVLLVMVFCLVSCNKEKNPDSSTKNSSTEKQEEHSHGHGPHGGEILEVDGSLHLEFVQEKEEGKVKLYVLGGDAKTPLAIAGNPSLNLTTSAGPKQLAMQGAEAKAEKNSLFVAEDAVLKEKLNGRISLNYGGKPYNVTIMTHDDHAHDDDDEHDHDDDDHDHDHDDHDHDHDDDDHDHDH